jgi:transcriptional regulator with XRE-family HTH domain
MPAYYKNNNEVEWGLEFGRNLQAILRSKHIHQGYLAKELGITEAMLSRYIHGTAVPSVYKVCQIANIIECDIGELVKNNYHN